MKTDTSRVSKAYRQIFFAVPLTVIALVALLVIASTNSSLLDRYFLVLMVLNLVAASVLVILTAWLCIRLFLQWRRHQFGSQMTLRLTIQITLIAVLPCLLLYAVSSRFIGRSIDSWFKCPGGTRARLGRQSVTHGTRESQKADRGTRQDPWLRAC